MATTTQPSTDQPSAAQPPARPAAAPTPAAAAPAAPKRKLVLPIVIVLVLLGAAWGLKQWLYGRGHEVTDNAQVDGHIIPVLAKVGGYVAEVRAEENTHVADSQPIVVIDPSEYRVKLAQAEADLSAAQAATGGGGASEAQVQTASSNRSALQAGVAAARANAARAQADLGRMRELVDKQIVSRQQLDAAVATAAAAQANVVAAERQASAAGSGITNAQAGVRLADARLQAAKAARDNAALQLSYATITAPAAGMVARKQVEVGQLVQPGQALMSVVPDTGVWVTANFKETQLSDLKVGQKVEVDVDAYGGATAEGTVESISSATGAKFALLPPDNATGNFTKVVQRVPVRIRVTKGLGAQRPLRPGMSVTAKVVTK